MHQIIAIAIIVGCMSVGLYFEFFSDKVDSVPEQLAEKVLEQHGIDVDFSADKKKKSR